MGKYLLFHRHHVVKLLLWIGMECGDIHYVIECASCCSQCCFQVFKSKPHYYPPEPPLKHLLNPFRKNDIPQVPEFTIGMLIASARAGRWLYETDSRLGLLFALCYFSTHNVYYVKCTRTFKRHVKAAGFVYVKKLLAHKFDPFPAVTLREFC